MRRQPDAQIRPTKNWFEENIECRVCKTFVPVDPTEEVKDNSKCGCGYLHSQHPDGVPVNTTHKWDYRKDTRTISTNAYGRLNFINEDGHQQPSFVKVSVDYENPEKRKIIMKLMESKWELPQPNLLISVTGGAKEFRNVPPQILEEFKRGLMKAAKSTNAWVITGGTNSGVMKLVGDAVRGSTFGSNITTIGIASWGIVKNKENLVRSTDAKSTKQKFVFDYPTKEPTLETEAYLDPNHSHFLLVDNGTQHKYGVEISMRGAVEGAIVEHYRNSYNLPGGESLMLPTICILVEGGPNSIATCLSAIQNGNPVLVLSGSRRSADLIAKAHNCSKQIIAYDGKRETRQRVLLNEYKEELLLDIRKEFARLGEEKQLSIFRSLEELLKYDDLLTVYHMSTEVNHGFDNAILIAMIRAHGMGGAKMSQMMLAITWDRLRIAEDLILTRHEFNTTELEQLLRASIIQNRDSFVRKILDCEADMKHYLTYEELTNLYNTMNSKTQTIGKIMYIKAQSRNKNGKISLRLIGELMEALMGGTYKSEFTRSKFNYNEKKHEQVENPYDEMVLFACIMQYFDMAELFWGRSKEPIATALMAAKICWYLSDFENNKLACDEDLAQQMKETGDKFENRASEVMVQCYRMFDRKDWTTILIAPRKLYSNLNLVQIAQAVSGENFLAESPVQSYLNHTWMGQIHHSTSMSKIFMCFVPPLFILLRYNKKDTTLAERQEWEREEESKLSKRKGIRSLIMGAPNTNTDEENAMEDNFSVLMGQPPLRRKLHWNESFTAYYTSPATKFILHFMTYFIFLTIYGFVIISKPVAPIAGNMTGLDALLFLWVLGQVPSEWDQLMKQNPKDLKSKVIHHFKDVFNVMDVLGIVTFFVCFALKLATNRVDDALGAYPISGNFTLINTYHLINIIAFVLFALRFIQIMEVSQQIGPKIIMIGKMMIDLAFFIFLMVIFLLTYGICAQALQFPNHEVRSSTIYNIILRPALNVFGEVGLEDLQADFLKGHCEAGRDCSEDDLTETLAHDQIKSIHYYFLQVFMFSYLLFVNILLVNLLIAIFSNTYETIESEASKLWKVQWCSVVTEFNARQPLPNPFSLIYFVIRFFQWLMKVLNCRRCDACIPKQIKQEIDYYSMCMQVAEAREEFQVKAEEADVKGDMQRTLKFIKDTLVNSAVVGANQKGVNRAFSFTAGSDEAEQKIGEIKNPDVHVDSIRSPYIGTSIKRYPLTVNQVPWEVSLPGYNPTDYTDPDIINNSNILETDPADPEEITQDFNKLSHVEGYQIDRISFSGKYALINHKPLNPKGRTGLVGRGRLERWGPNHTAEPIVSRWSRDSEGNQIFINNRPVLEFVAVFLRDSKKWSIPGGPIKPGEALIHALKREFGEDALGAMEADAFVKDRIKEMMQEHLALGIAVYKGYVDDPRNTDNAWIESHAINYHDSLGSSFGKFPLRVSQSGEALRVQWLPLDKNLDLYGNHEWILEKVCWHRQAYNPFSETNKKYIPVIDS